MTRSLEAARRHGTSWRSRGWKPSSSTALYWIGAWEELLERAEQMLDAEDVLDAGPDGDRRLPSSGPG
jgi:hypothetical protein